MRHRSQVEGGLEEDVELEQLPAVAAPGAGQPGAGTSPCLQGHVYAAGRAGGEAEGGGEAVTGGNELQECQEEGAGCRGQHQRENQ